MRMNNNIRKLAEGCLDIQATHDRNNGLGFASYDAYMRVTAPTLAKALILALDVLEKYKYISHLPGESISQYSIAAETLAKMEELG